MKNYYKILEIPKTATAEEIKKAYRKLALKWHPDKNQGSRKAEEKFKEVLEAHEVLKDPAQRLKYDHGDLRSVPAFNFQDAFRNFMSRFGFGHSFHKPFEMDGENIKVHLDVTLEEIAKGVDKSVKYERMQRCNSCNGLGGTEVVTCPGCGGTGQAQHTVTNGPQTIINVRWCVQCGGCGKILNQVCKICNGSGRIKNLSTVKLDILPGAENGSFVKVEDGGNYGIHGGRAGYLFVVVREKPHDKFMRDKNNLICVREINVVDAILGGECEIDGLFDRIKLKIPLGTQHGQSLSIKGYGLPSPTGQGFGDLIVLIHLHVPNKISDEDKKAIGELRSCKSLDPG